MSRLDEVIARCAGATEGPWEIDIDEEAVATAMELVMICHPYDMDRPRTSTNGSSESDG